MQDSDHMLMTTLSQMIDYQINTPLISLQSDSLVQISIRALGCCKVDGSQVINLSKNSQRFRSMARLNQLLHQTFELHFELNELMNPNPSFIRKFIVTIIGRLTAKQEQKPLLTHKVQSNRFKTAFEHWRTREWIHPSFIKMKPRNQSYLLPIAFNKTLLSKNNTYLNEQLNNIPSQTAYILRQTVAKHEMRMKVAQEKQGIAQKDTSEEMARVLTAINRANLLEWQSVQHRDSTNSIVKSHSFREESKENKVQVKKYAPKVIETVESEENSITEQTEVQINPLQIIQKKLQRANEQSELQLQNLMQQLKEKKEQIMAWEEEKGEIQANIKEQQEMCKRNQNICFALESALVKQQTVLKSIEEDRDLEAEVILLEKETKQLKQVAQMEIKKEENEMKELISSAKIKIQALADLKLKLHRIQNQYHQTVQQLEEKVELRSKVKIQKSGIPRSVYHKKISQIQNRWKEVQKQSNKTKKILEQLKGVVANVNNKNKRVQAQVINMVSVHTKDAEGKLLKENTQKCIEIFNNTIETVFEINKVKEQAQLYQIKVHQLSGKNYKSALLNIEQAIADLKKQTNAKSK